MSKVYMQINSIAGANRAVFGSGGGRRRNSSSKPRVRGTKLHASNNQRKTEGPGGGSDPGNIANDHGVDKRAPRKDIGDGIHATSLALGAACLKTKNPRVCTAAAASALVDGAVNYDWKK